ncbi:hypothetical protein OG285_00980 [Streptomyces sp. NBC_01471]|uniref:hypothetical protein n=1 Tax=Streptomyces sp. NBC_01471 TaxID=2903879 RepID=UPI0032468DE2
MLNEIDQRLLLGRGALEEVRLHVVDKENGARGVNLPGHCVPGKAAFLREEVGIHI